MYISCWISANSSEPAIWTFVGPVILITCVSFHYKYHTEFKKTVNLLMFNVSVFSLLYLF